MSYNFSLTASRPTVPQYIKGPNPFVETELHFRYESGLFSPSNVTAHFQVPTDRESGLRNFRVVWVSGKNIGPDSDFAIGPIWPYYLFVADLDKPFRTLYMYNVMYPIGMKRTMETPTYLLVVIFQDR